jgi:hypothetical protein
LIAGPDRDMSCTGKLLPIRAGLELADRSIDRPDPPEQLQLPDLAQAVAEDAKSAFVTGLHAAAAVASVLHVALGVLALRWLPPSCTCKTGCSFICNCDEPRRREWTWRARRVTTVCRTSLGHRSR